MEHFKRSGQRGVKQIEEQGLAAGGVFSELLAKRELKNTEEDNRIMAAINDTQNKTGRSIVPQ